MHVAITGHVNNTSGVTHPLDKITTEAYFVSS